MLHQLSKSDLTGKAVLLRVDFNVPVHDGEITDDTRIFSAIPTINIILAHAKKLVIIAHRNRPKSYDPQDSLGIIATKLADILDQNVAFFPGPIDEEVALQVRNLDEKIILLDNLRFNPGEEDNDSAFGKLLASLADIYVNDAFSASHRDHASVVALPELMPSFAGINFCQEVETLTKIIESQEHPSTVIIGGAKISTKIKVLSNLIPKIDNLIVGGAMANNFLVAMGHKIGASLYEPDMVETAKALIEQAKKSGCNLIIPEEFIVAENINSTSYQVKKLTELQDKDSIFDIAESAVEKFIATARQSKLVLWNGPIGAFEYASFAKGTELLAQGLAKLAGTKVILGGGDTISAVKQAKQKLEDYYYVSIAGGAFLEFLEQGTLPGVTALAENYVC